jgi:hypothetical protein
MLSILNMYTNCFQRRKGLFHRDSDTGYYDDEPDDEEARLDAQQAQAEDRFEVEAEEAHARLWAGPIGPYDDPPITFPPRREMLTRQKEVA